MEAEEDSKEREGKRERWWVAFSRGPVGIPWVAARCLLRGCCSEKNRGSELEEKEAEGGPAGNPLRSSQIGKKSSQTHRNAVCRGYIFYTFHDYTHSILSLLALPNQNRRNTSGNRTLVTFPVPSSKTAPFSNKATISRGIAAAVPLRV